MATLLALLVWLLVPQPKPACTPQFAPLHTGASSGAVDLDFWRTEDAGAWGGRGWVGWSHEGTRLLPVELIVKALPQDAVPGEDEYVTVDWRPKEVAYAVRCMPAIRPGAMLSAGFANHSLGSGDGSLPIALGSRSYTIRLDTKRHDLTDARVILSDGARSQVLYAVDGFVDEPFFDIEWAGDIDRDGRLDLVTNLSRKYSMHPHTLWLSSKAPKGQLVGAVSVFMTGN